jgi:hypothetical protein
MKPEEIRQLIEAEARRQGLSVSAYLATRFMFSELARDVLRQVIEQIRK